MSNKMDKSSKGLIIAIIVLAVVIVVGGIAIYNVYENKVAHVSTDTGTITLTNPKIRTKDYQVGETISSNGHSLTINNVTHTFGTHKDFPAPGYNYRVLDVTLTNNTNKEMPYNVNDFFVVNSAKQEAQPAATFIDPSTNMTQGFVKPDSSVTKTVVFTEPTNDHGLNLIFSGKMFYNIPVHVSLKNY